MPLSWRCILAPNVASDPESAMETLFLSSAFTMDYEESLAEASFRRPGCGRGKFKKNLFPCPTKSASNSE
jgi:hypothetical protein